MRDTATYDNGNIAAHGASILADVALLESKEQASLVANSQAKEIFQELFNTSWCPYGGNTLEQLQTLPNSIITAINCGDTIMAERIPAKYERVRKTRCSAFEKIEILFEKHAKSKIDDNFDVDPKVVKLVHCIAAYTREVVAACRPHNRGELGISGKSASPLL